MLAVKPRGGGSPCYFFQDGGALGAVAAENARDGMLWVGASSRAA